MPDWQLLIMLGLTFISGFYFGMSHQCFKQARTLRNARKRK